MPDIITEFVAAGSKPLEAAEGVVRSVKVLGSESRNGRFYEPGAIQNAASKYEGVRVNIDHAAKPNEPRRYADRFGTLENVQVKPDGLYADLRFNPRHSLAEQFAWDAQHSPANVGLSHNVAAKVKKAKDGRSAVESIEKVISVDVVADPATVRSLYESETNTKDGAMSDTITVAKLKEQGVYDLIREEILEDAKNDSELETLRKQNKSLQSKLDALEKSQAAAQRRIDLAKLAIESGIPEGNVSESWLDIASKLDDDDVAALIEEKKGSVKPGPAKPKAKEQHVAEGGSTTQWQSMDARGFAAAITE